jgi:hypothetical protein
MRNVTQNGNVSEESCKDTDAYLWVGHTARIPGQSTEEKKEKRKV